MPQGLQVPYVELGQRQGASSPEEGCDLTTPNARRTLMVNWSDRKEAEWQIIGTAWLDTECKLRRWLPEQHPDKPWLWATRISRSYGIEPVGVTVMGTGFFDHSVLPGSGLQGSPIGSTGSGVSWAGHRSINTYRYCVFEVEYTRPPYNIVEDEDVESEVERYVEYLPEFQGDYLSVPYEASSGATGFKFVETGRNYPGNVGVIVPAEIERLKWWQVPEVAVNETAIWDLVGKVNDASWFDGRFSYAREHLLFCGLERERVWLPHDGSPAWNITFLFKWFKYGHNHFYDFYKKAGFDPGWRKCTVGGGENDPTLYEYGDFDGIFTPNAEPCGSGSGSWVILSGGEEDSWHEWVGSGQIGQPDTDFSFSTK